MKQGSWIRGWGLVCSCVLAAWLATGCGGGGHGRRGPLPAAPTGVFAIEGSTEVSIYWTAVPDATSYNIYWSTTPGVRKATGTAIPGALSGHLHSGLTNGMTYYYVVTTLQGTAESAESSEVAATPYNLGMLDTSFGGPGWVVHHDAAGGNDRDWGLCIAVDVSGRILVAGLSFNLADSDMVIWRYGPDGSLDTTFNGQGWVVYDSGAGADPSGWGESGSGIALDPSDRIVVTGRVWRAGGDFDMAIWRYASTGMLDTTFGSGGVVVHHGAAGGAGDDGGGDLVLDAGGRVIVTGSSANPLGDSDMVVWTYDDSGTLDPSFNGQGWVVHDSAAGGGGNDGGAAILLDGWSRLAVAGTSSNPAGDQDMVIWRYNPDGSLDTSFNGQGWVVHDNAAGGSDEDLAIDIATDLSGRVIVTGRSVNASGDTDMVLWRYSPGGTLDSTFGPGGVVVHDGAAGGAGPDQGSAIAMDASGHIIVAGESTSPAGFVDMVVWRYHLDGSLDTTFNGQGWVVHDNAAGGNDRDWSRGVALDAMGKVLVAGTSWGAEFDMVVWRYR